MLKYNVLNQSENLRQTYYQNIGNQPQQPVVPVRLAQETFHICKYIVLNFVI